MKTCTKCQESKELSLFSKSAASKDGHRPSCKACVSKVDQAYSEKHSSARNKRASDWNRNNNESRRAISSRWQKNNMEYVLGVAQLRRARKSQVETGYLPKNYRAILFAFFDHRCAFPGCGRVDLQLDHVVPLALGGPHTALNFQVLCGFHNTSKNASRADYRRRAIVGFPRRMNLPRGRYYIDIPVLPIQQSQSLANNTGRSPSATLDSSNTYSVCYT